MQEPTDPYDQLMHTGHVFWFGQWTVRSADLEPCQDAIRALLAFSREGHPEKLSIRVFRNIWSADPRWTYMWVEEYKDWTTIQNRPGRIEEREAWLKVLEFAQPATYSASLWLGVLQHLWSEVSSRQLEEPTDPYDQLMRSGSVFWFGQWTVRSADLEPSQNALEKLLTFSREGHPEKLSIRVFRNTWSGVPRYTHMWVEEYKDLTTIQSRPNRLEEREAWLRHALEFEESATYRAGLWAGVHQNLWLEGSR